MVTHYTPQVAPGIIETRGGLCTDRYMKHLGNMIFRCVSISSTYPGQSITNWHFQISTLSVSLESSLERWYTMGCHICSESCDFTCQSVFFKCFFVNKCFFSSNVVFLLQKCFFSSKVVFSSSKVFFFFKSDFSKSMFFLKDFTSNLFFFETCFFQRVFLAALTQL